MISIRFIPLILILMFALGACSEDDDPVTPPPPPPPPPPTLTWAGSDACYPCHQEEYDAWKDSGHASAMIEVAGASPDSAFPSFSAFAKDPVTPPTGLEWEDVSYVIGGYAWKIHWLDADGFLVTGAEAQYNFEDGSRATYEPEGTPGPRPFDCGLCHATGWTVPEPEPADKADLTGIAGSFFAAGVHCEECHGMGSFHVAEPDSNRMTVDRTSEACARCHRRLAADAIAASDGFILNYQQYSEWKASPHSGPDGPGCNDCHNPHASSHFAEADFTGITRLCYECHPGFDGPTDHPTDASCVDCHMAKAVRSAISPETNVGDVRSHIVRMSSSFVKEDSMFTEAGDRVRLDHYGQAAITKDFTCMVCHQSGKSAPPLAPGILEGGAWQAHGSR